MYQRIDFFEGACSHHLRDFAESLYVVRIMCPFGCLFNQGRSFKRFAAQSRDASFELGGKLMLPSAKHVNPSLHGILVDRVFVKRADATPAIIIDQLHWRL